jgi:hypothetical protein
MPTTIAAMPSETTTWIVQGRVLRIIGNPDFLAVAGFTALGLLLTLGLMSALRLLGELTNLSFPST